MTRDRFSAIDGAGPSYLLRTNDGGNSWESAAFEKTPERLTRLVTSPASQALAIGESGVLVRDAFGSRSRFANGLPQGFLMLDGAYLSTGRIVLVGGSGSVAVSNDGGSTWRAQFKVPRAERLNAVAFDGDGRGWAVGRAGSMVYSNDHGGTWQPRIGPTTADLNDIELTGHGNGFVVGDGGTIMRKEPGSNDWLIMRSPVHHRLERLAVAGDRVFAVGFGGTILRTDLDEGSGLAKERTK